VTLHDKSKVARAFRRAPGERPFVLGHRGARHAAPENTLRAFELAATEGADGFELDVRLDGSDVPVVVHDTTLARVTQNRDCRTVANIPTRELARVDVGGGEAVPTLASVLDFARSKNLRVNVELKHDVPAPARLVTRVVELVRAEPNAPDWLILSCFHPLVVTKLARALPHVPVAWLVHKQQRVLKHAPGFSLLGAVALHPEHVLVTEPLLARFRRLGALINVWTVNDPARARVLSELGVDAIISDNPGAILAELARSPAAQNERLRRSS
jgi:glycerophosphoryl diester phosphodiesterase